MAMVEKSIEVERNLTTVYNQWTQLESFPQFMQGVEKVEQLDDRRVRWHADIGMAEREWTAEIVEQVPDQVIAWRATGEVGNSGRVPFQPLAAERTRVSLVLEYDPEGLLEKAGDALGIVDRRVEGDLERFRQFIEERGTETGGYRGPL